MNFSERVVKELEKRGWSRSEAARRGDISPSMFDKVINGYAEPGMKFLKGISKAFGVSLYEVVSWIEGSSESTSELDEAKFEGWKYLLEGLSKRDLNILRDIAEKMAAENEKERAQKSLNPRQVGNG